MKKDNILQYLVISATLTVSIIFGQTGGVSPPSKYAFLKAHQEGDNPKDYLYIGGLFGIHYMGDVPGQCGAIRARGVHNLEAFLWAIKSYQSRHLGALKGIKIGAIGFDSCSDTFHLQQQIANFRQGLVEYGEPVVDPDKLLAFVGPDKNDDSKTLASYLANNGPPLISHAATSDALSDKQKYPYFLRTVPSDVIQVEALIKIIQKQEWNFLQVIYSDNAYGQSSKESFVAAAENSGICVTNNQIIPATMSDDDVDAVLHSVQQNRKTRAVVVLADKYSTRALLEAMDRQKKDVRGYFTWYGTTTWATNHDVIDDVEQLAEGAVTLSLESFQSEDYYNQFQNHFDGLTPQINEDNPWFKQYWSEVFKCYFFGVPNPNGYNNSLCDDMTVSLRATELDMYVSYTIKAVDAVLNGIDMARRKLCAISADGLCDNLVSGNKWKTIFDSIVGVGAVFNKTSGGPLQAHYNINNLRAAGTGCKDHCYVQIGVYSASSGNLSLEAVDIHTYNVLGKRIYDERSQCSQNPCVVCGGTSTTSTTETQTTTTNRPIMEPAMRKEVWVIPLISLTSIGVALVIIFDIYLLCKIFGTPYMKHWRTMWLGQLLLVGILISYLTLYAFIITPTKATCGIIRFGVGASYAMCFSVLLVKLMILLSSESFGYLKGAFQVLMFLFAWGIQIVVGTEWLLLRHPNAVPSTANPDMMICKYGDFTSQIQSLVYVMLLIVICTGMAIRTSRISTNHREGVFIGLCAGFTIPIFIVWILLGALYNDQSFHDPCVAFGLLATTTLIFFVMFLPKVRQLSSMGVEGIYAEDDRHTDISPAIGHVSPPSVSGYPTKAGPPSIIGYAPSHTGEGSVVLLSNGEVGYGEPIKIQPVVRANPNALYLRHPATLQRVRNVDNVSMHSAPLGNTHHRRLPATHARHPEGTTTLSNGDNIHATTRVLRMTNDLTGRRTPVIDRRANTEQPRPGSRVSNPETQTHTFTDIGAL